LIEEFFLINFSLNSAWDFLLTLQDFHGITQRADESTRPSDCGLKKILKNRNFSREKQEITKENSISKNERGVMRISWDKRIEDFNMRENVQTENLFYDVQAAHLTPLT
jgi:hypothetical protein